MVESVGVKPSQAESGTEKTNWAVEERLPDFAAGASRDYQRCQFYAERMMIQPNVIQCQKCHSILYRVKT